MELTNVVKGTPRHEHLKHDLDKVTQIVTESENNISPLSIWDLFRLGKYRDQSSKPRPILVRLTRTIDVSLLLSKARTLPKEIRIKPSMTREGIPPVKREMVSNPVK